MEIPSIPGSITSRTTRSKGFAARRISNARSPSATASVSMPSRARAYSTTSLTAGSSSTISTLIILHLLQPQFDPCSVAFFGLQGDLSAHTLDQLFADGQTEVEPLRVAYLVEALEDVGDVLLTDPRPLVLHGEHRTLRPQPNVSTLLGVLDGVAYEHQQRLLQPLLVDPGPRPFALRGDRQPRAIGERSHALSDPRRDLPKVRRCDLRVPAVPAGSGEPE